MPSDKDLIEVPGHRVFVPGQRAVTSGGSGVNDFLGLDDTPGNYTGDGGKFVRVNTGESALEFTDLSFVTRLLEKQVIDINDFSYGQEVLSGTGAITYNEGFGSNPMKLSTGTTNPSGARTRLLLPVTTNLEQFLSQVNFDNDIEFIYIMSDDRSGSASDRFADIKVVASTALGVLAFKGVGVRINRNSLTFDCLSHDGTAVQTTAVTKPTTTSQWRLHIRHNAGTSVEFLLDGAVVATHTTRVPAGIASVSFLFEVAQTSGVDLDLTIARFIIVQDWTA